MKTRLLIAKYIRDPRRWEPVNVGVVVVRGDEGQARFVGERAPGSIDRRATRYLVGDTETYAEWVAYWRRMLTKGAEGSDEILDMRTPNYWVAEQGEVWLGSDEETLEELCRRYFGELVARSEDELEPEAPELKRRVERVIEEAELRTAVERLDRDVVVPSIEDPPEQFRFHYVAENGHKTLAHRVAIGPLWIHDAVWKFENVAPDYRKVAFISGEEAPDELRPTLLALMRRASIIDAYAGNAAERVREAFGID